MLSTGPIINIYYDRKYLYHPITPDGCRYVCNFPDIMVDLRKGDVAVLTDNFYMADVQKLQQNGVIIGFESIVVGVAGRIFI